VREARARPNAADLLAIATTEYNGSVPPLLKNPIALASEEESVVTGKLVA
jgi:NAD(P)H-dependent FMN reductase